MENLNKKSIKVKDTILELLDNPQTATDIKEKLLGISSMGTVLYHLKNLVNEGLLVREKQTKVRGQPTYYYLASLKRRGFNSLQEFISKSEEEQKEKKIKATIEALKILKKGKKSLWELDEELNKRKELDEDSIWQIVGNKNIYVKQEVDITPEGLRFLKENSKK
jgi:predicted ArsR family transcriptional regulator